MKIYLAGKIGKNDWRNNLVPNLRTAKNIGEKTWPILEKGISGQHDYVGPFFTACDHGCYHGPSSHGEGVSQEINVCSDPGISPEQTFTNCMEAIQKCTVLFAWIDSPDCYGSIAEIGYAKAANKRIVIGRQYTNMNLWFVYQFADEIIEASSPEQAFLKMITNAWKTIKN